MATILTCPSCGKLSQVPDKAPGSAVRCPHCSAVMKVPAKSTSKSVSEPLAVSPQKSAAESRRQSLPQTSVSSPATPSADRVVTPAVVEPPIIIALPPAEPPVPGLPPLLPPVHTTDAASSAGYICVVCGNSFPFESVYDLNGSVICETCNAASAGIDPAGAAAPGSFPMVPTLSAVMAEEPPQEQFPAAVADDPHGVDTESATESEAEIEPSLPAGTDLEPSDPSGDIAELGDVAHSSMRAQREPGEKPFPMVLVVSGSCAAILVLVGLMFYLTRSHQSSVGESTGPTADWPGADQTSADDQTMSEWEKKYAPRLSKWRSTAKSLELSGDNGDLAHAQMLYKQMIELAKSPGATISSTGVQAELAEAQASYDRITQKIGPPPTFVAQAPLASDSQTAIHVPAETPATPQSENPAATAPVATTAPAPVVPVVDWETAHRDNILKLSHDANAFEQHGQPLPAFLESVSLLQLVGDHRATLADPQLKAAVDAADAARKRLRIAARDSDDVRMISARSLLAAGLRAEQDKKWQTALDNLIDASHLLAPFLRPVQRYRDPTYLAALDGTAIAYMNLKQPVRADELFADSEPLGVATKVVNSPSRDLIWNRAANDLAGKTNVLRSVKMVRDYMDPQTTSDEPLLNLLGTLLFIADESNPPNPKLANDPNRKIIDDAIGFYSQRSMDLEKTHPGQQRWGVEWLAAADAKVKFDEYNKAIDAYQTLTRQKTAADNRVKDLENAARAPNGIHPSPVDMSAAKAKVTAAVAALKTAHDAIPRPTWLSDVQPVVPIFDAAAPVTISLAGPATAPAAPTPAAPATAAPTAAAAVPAASGTGASAAGVSVTGAPATGAPATGVPASGVSASGPALSIIPPVIPEARYAAAFPIDRTHLITAAAPLGSAASVTIQNTRGEIIPARVVGKSDRLALLEVAPADAAGGLKYFPLTTDFTGGPVYCAAIPQANIFIPVVTQLPADSAPVPTRSEWWVALSDSPRLAGSPLLDAQNQVIGVEVAAREDDRRKIPAVTLDDLRKFLDGNHIVPGAAGDKPDANLVWQVSAIAE